MGARTTGSTMMCLALLLLGTACSSKPGAVSLPPGDPLIIAFSPVRSTVNTAIAGATAVVGQASQVEVFLRQVPGDPTTEQIIRAADGVFPFTVPIGAANVPVPAAFLEIPTGYVTQIRMQVDALQAVFPSGNVSVSLPGGALRILPATTLQIPASGESDLLARLDPAAIVAARCGTLKMVSPSLSGTVAQPIDVAAGVPSDRLSVFFKGGTTATTIASVLAGYDARASLEHRFPDGLASVILPGDRLLSGALTYFQAQPSVDFVAGGWPVISATLPNETVGGSGYFPYFETATSEAHQISMGDTRPIIAVIDSGMRLDHPDLLLNVWINEGELPAGMRANGQPGAGADFDGDGLVTMRDLNTPGHDAVLSSFGIGKTAGDPNSVDGYDLLAALSNKVDDDNNGFVDDLVGWNFLQNTNDPTPPTDNDQIQTQQGMVPNGDIHGRIVAGAAAAVANNGYGVVGVAPFARIMPLRFIAASGAGSSILRESALSYAAMMHADVVNVSNGSLLYKSASALDQAFGVTDESIQSAASKAELNCTPTPAAPSLGAQAQLVTPTQFNQNKTQLDATWQHYGSSFLIAKATGNCGAFLSNATRSTIFADGVGVPNVSNLITVAGMSSANPGSIRPPQEFVDGEQGSEAADIAAPYESVAVLGQIANDPSGRFGATGTSISTPFVAGTAALILSAQPSLRGQWAVLRQRILDNADKGIAQAVDREGPGQNLVKAGTELVRDGNRLNVCQALAGGACPIPPQSPFPDAGTGGPMDAGSVCDGGPQPCDGGLIWNPQLCSCDPPIIIN